MQKTFLRLFLLLSIVGFVVSCGTKEEPVKSISEMSDEELKNYANELAHQYIIVDGHVDLPYRMRVSRFRLQKEWIDVSQRTDEGDFDFPRAKEGGLDAPFMSIYIPSSFQVTGGAKDFADSLIDVVNKIEETYPDQFAVTTSPDEIEKNFAEGKISLPMGMENGAPIEDDINNVAYFHERGIRYITLTHSTDNQICDSSYDTTRTHGGLSAFGRDVVKEMNRVGIMVDISHVSDDTFFQVVEMTDVPVIASHSSCRYYTPGFERNMSDEMLPMLAENGGVIMINFGSSFLDSAVVKSNNEKRDELRAILEEQGLQASDSAAQPVIEQFRADNPRLYADVQKVADHIDHVVQLAGIDHVGLGSDYDGVGDSLPTGLKDVSGYPNLIYELLKRGYSAEDIEKICYGNVFRVWRDVERAARESSSV